MQPWHITAIYRNFQRTSCYESCLRFGILVVLARWWNVLYYLCDGTWSVPFNVMWTTISVDLVSSDAMFVTWVRLLQVFFISEIYKLLMIILNLHGPQRTLSFKTISNDRCLCSVCLNLCSSYSAFHECMCLLWRVLNGDYWNRGFIIFNRYSHISWTSAITPQCTVFRLVMCAVHWWFIIITTNDIDLQTASLHYLKMCKVKVLTYQAEPRRCNFYIGCTQ